MFNSNPNWVCINIPNWFKYFEHTKAYRNKYNNRSTYKIPRTDAAPKRTWRPTTDASWARMKSHMMRNDCALCAKNIFPESWVCISGHTVWDPMENLENHETNHSLHQKWSGSLISSVLQLKALTLPQASESYSCSICLKVSPFYFNKNTQTSKFKFFWHFQHRAT